MTPLAVAVALALLTAACTGRPAGEATDTEPGARGDAPSANAGGHGDDAPDPNGDQPTDTGSEAAAAPDDAPGPGPNTARLPPVEGQPLSAATGPGHVVVAADPVPSATARPSWLDDGARPPLGVARHVDCHAGDDANPGTAAEPLRTLAALGRQPTGTDVVLKGRCDLHHRSVVDGGPVGPDRGLVAVDD
ncbi:MAG: hypothetical protein AAGK32_08425, partial [Actinomycetota bacterium]